MATQIPPFEPGFGTRLKEERVRLKSSQAKFAEWGGVKRLAQMQYESEVTSPTVKYLAAICARGADISYLWSGQRAAPSLDTDVRRRIEREAFELVEDYEASNPLGPMSPESRHTLFEVVRAQLLLASFGEDQPEWDLPDLVLSRIVR